MITLDALQLPDNLRWVDEFAWQPLAMNRGYTLGGKLVLETARMLKGRPITLADENAWISRSDLETLYSMAGAGAVHTLTLHDGRSFQVMWRYDDAPVIEAEPIVPYASPDSGDQYALLAIKLREVA